MDNKKNNILRNNDEEVQISNMHVHASIINRLGEELISSEITAFSELIKNSYDADSPIVDFFIDSFYTGVEEVEIKTSNSNQFEKKQVPVSGIIRIEDKGIGMSLEDIERGWLTISNSLKKKFKSQEMRTTKYNRYPIGEKGLGRISLHRLGNISTLITKKEDSNIEYTVKIPWLMYEEDITLEEVKIKIYKRTVENTSKGYTKIIIKDLKNRDLWNNKKNIREFEKNLMQITSPFSKDFSFLIKGMINGKKFNSQLISNTLLEKRRSEYEVKLEGKKLTINGYLDRRWFIRNNNYPTNEEMLDFFNSEFNKMKTTFKLIDDNKFKVMLDIKINDIKNGVDGLYMIDKYHPGDFYIRLYDFNLDAGYFQELVKTRNIGILENVTSYREAVKNFNGVYVIRDSFTVLPYGYDGKDWLGINTSSKTGGTFYDIKNDTIIGYIKLDGMKNKNLKEKTDREGFIENFYYNNFIKIINKAIGEIKSKTSSIIKNNYNKYKEEKYNDKTKIKNTDDALGNVNKAVNRLKQNNNKRDNEINGQINLLNKNMHNNSQESEDTNKETEQYLHQIQSSMDYLKRVLEEQTERVEELAHLAGLGLVSEALTHDMITTLDNLEVYTNKVKKNIKANINNLIENYFDYVITTINLFRKQISHMSPGFMIVREKKDTIDIYMFVMKFQDFYKDRSEKKGIKINIIKKGNFEIYMNKGQLNQVLDNLYLNSEYWLSKYKKNTGFEETNFYIEISDNNTLNIWDNGYGISKNREEDLFYPFVTDKDKGRGLGLYIVQSILANNKADICLLQERNNNNNRYKFKITFAD
ncbi:ATP-binding protein [Sporosalibacterium faouarense]|uniref:ATP-binding protein n=1 Tax=Sporosalibacterium faouarense TaxID=516123 RepID=UPI00192B6555|nr:ATP-binding protein [Sporosalibacterium faouarense]